MEKRSSRFKRTTFNSTSVAAPIVPGVFNSKEFHRENEATSTFYTRSEFEVKCF